MTYHPNEKTLEINVMSSILNEIRIDYPSAFAYGFTLYNEQRNGLDSSIDLSPYATLVSFQFKKPYRNKGSTFWFKFNNNNNRNQHDILCRTAQSVLGRDSVYYALPAYESTFSLEQDSPDFLEQTFTIDPLSVGLLSDNKIHQFEIDTHTLTTQVHSDFKKTVKAKKMKSILKLIKHKEIGTKVEEINKKIDKIYEKSQRKIMNEIGMTKETRVFLKGIVIPERI